MSAEIMSLSFEDILNVPAEELSEKIPPEIAVQVTLKSFQTDDVPNCDIYKTWATVLFQQYGPAKLREEDLNELLNTFTVAIKELIDVCTHDECSEKLEDLLTFLSCSLQLFTWTHSVATELSLHEVTAFLCFGLSVVDNYLTIIVNKKNLRRFLEKSLAVQKMILHILSSVGSTQTYAGNDLPEFRELVLHLCSIGEKTPKLDIKTAVDTWKATIKLLSQNTDLTETDSTVDSTWLSRPMKFLIQEIGRNVQAVYSENSLKEPIEQIEKYLKVTNFYLRLLQKVTTDFQHTTFPACREYVENLVVIYCPPQTIVDSPVEKLITEYVTMGFKELIQFTCKNRQFFEFLLETQSDDFEKNECVHKILLNGIEVAMRKNEIQFLDAQMLGRIFKNCLQNSYIVLSTRLYNRFLEIFAAIHSSARPEQFEKDLIQAVLQDDVVLATAAIDVWCIVFRNATRSERSTYFLFWREINEHFSKYSTQLSSIHVEVLLKNLYAMLNTEEKDSIWVNFDARMLTNDRFLLTIGLESIPNGAQRRRIIEHYACELLRFLRECARDMTIDNFYSIIREVKLLTPTSLNSEEINDILLQYLEISMKHKKFDLFTESVLNFLATRSEFIKDSRILNILTDLSTELPRFRSYDMKLSLFKFLTSVAKNIRLKEHATNILRFYEKDELIQHFGHAGKQTPQRFHQKPNNDLLREIVKKRSLNVIEDAHACQMEEDVPAKRMKKDIDDVLESLETAVDKLRAVAKVEPLDSSKIRIIRQIVGKLEALEGLS